MSADFNPHLRAAILEAVENQITNNNPPETRQTYERLLREGISEHDAKVLIANIVAAEIFEVINRREPYNHERFVLALSRLPELPEE
jgi:ribosomal protein L11 methylase PrmA